MKTEFFSKVTEFIKLYGQSLFSNEKDVNKLIFNSKKLLNIDGFVNNGTNVTTAENGGKMPARHSVFNQILLDSSGKVDMNQFSVDAIKSRYSEDKYSVEEVEKNGSKSVFVKNKNTGLNEYAVEYEYDENNNPYYHVVDFDSKGDITRRIIVNNALIDGLIECNDDDSYIMTLYNEGNMSDIASKTYRYSDGSSESTYYINSEKDSVFKYDKDDKFISGEKYIGGKLYGYCDEQLKMTSYTFVEDFTKMYKKLNSKKDVSAFISYLTGTLNSKNIVDFIKDYAVVNNESFIGLIEENDIFDDKQKEEILDFCHAMISKNLGDSPEVAAKKNMILFAFRNNDSDALKKHIDSINQEDAQNIISSFGTFSFDTSPLLLKRTSDNLFQMILMSNMSNEDKSKCIENILNKLFGYCDYNNIYMQDILDDVNSHITDINKLEVDFVRLVSRSAKKMDNPTADIGVPDGKISLDFKQGNTGDCWFVGGLKSIIRKGGARYLESLLKIDDKNKTVTVQIPNKGREYTITFDEISKFNFLSNNPNIRAFEIAADRYLKERAYGNMISLSENSDMYLVNILNTKRKYGFIEDDYSFSEMRDDILNDADIEGDTLDHTYDMFLHNNMYSTNIDISKFNFNKSDKAYSVSFSGNAYVEGYRTDTHEYVKIDTHHAYIPVSSDEDYIYVEDPRVQGDNITKISRKALASLSVRVGEANART